MCSLKPLADMAATAFLREALSKGISSGSLVDTKIILYSHRDSSGRVCRPKVLYANSHVLQTVPYFNNREYTATLDIARRASYKLKCSSGTSQSPSRETSPRKQLTVKNPQKTTGICLIVTLRTMRMRRPLRLQFLARTKRSSVKNTRSA